MSHEHNHNNEVSWGRRLRKRITNTLRKPTTRPTKLAKESELVLNAIC